MSLFRIQNIIIIIFVCLSNKIAYSVPVNDIMEYENITFRVQDFADLVVKKGDNKKTPFIILDKKKARIYIYDHKGIILGDAPVLLGLAIGDELSHEIARLPLSQIKPSNRITPAGRFIAEIGKDTHGKDVLWVDFNGNLAIHPVINVPHQHRNERLLSENIDDNRISWGCINVPKLFFRKYIGKNFATKKGMVYILPEVKSLNDYIWFEKN
jgi:hypothetical protein